MKALAILVVLILLVFSINLAVRRVNKAFESMNYFKMSVWEVRQIIIGQILVTLASLVISIILIIQIFEHL